MKIAYDAKRYFHNNTGLGNYSRTLIRDINRFHHDIETTLYDSKTLERTFRLGRKAKEEGCVLFHGLSNELPRDILKAGMPSIVTMHDVAWRTFPDMYKPWDRLIYDWKYGWSAKHATHVVCISESTKRDVMRFYNILEERISVIYQPVQELFYEQTTSPTPASIERYIITVGSINSRKNLLNMVKAYERLPKANRPKFLVVGNGREYRRKVEQYIAEHGLQNDITIRSDIHDASTLKSLYAGAVCMIYPSFYEGFGLPVVEAALQRCPVITSNVSSLPEAAGPEAIQCNPNSVDELTNALLLLTQNEQERTARGNACHDYCRSMFNPATLTHQMYELYHSLL